MGSSTEAVPLPAFSRPPKRPKPVSDARQTDEVSTWQEPEPSDDSLSTLAPVSPLLEELPLQLSGISSFPGNHEGFIGFDLRVFPPRERLFEAHIVWHEDDDDDPRANEVVDASAAEQGVCHESVEAAAAVVQELLDRSGLVVEQIDLLIASQYPPDFALRLARALSIPEDRVPYVSEALAHSHAAGELAAFEAALTSGAFAESSVVLFVAVSPGITVRTALYRQSCATGMDDDSRRACVH